MNIYELNEEIQIAETMIEEYAREHEGDITDCDFDKILDELKLEKDEKFLGIAEWIVNLKAEADAIKAQASILSKRQSAISNKADRLKDFLGYSVEKGKKFKNAKVAISWRKSKSVEFVGNVENLAPEYTKTTVSANKTEIKNALGLGVAIEGASIKENFNISIK